MLTRKDFFVSAVSFGGLSLMAGTRGLDVGSRQYAVAVLGDTHFDAEPESVYHSHYDESNRWAKIQHAEFRRNGEMWRGRCRDLLAASGRLAAAEKTDFILQLGDLIQGDCDDRATHQRMMDDCVRLFRSYYPDDLPLLTVLGNHDVRGKGAREAYLNWAETRLAKELAHPVKYPVFAFRRGPDHWIFCDFETQDLAPVIAAVEGDPDARHVFLVTHGPFTPYEVNSPEWRLGGGRACDALRPKLYEALSRRRAVVLSGHTHSTTCSRHENAWGGFAEFTFNSVWKAPELASLAPVVASAAEYGRRAKMLSPDHAKQFETAASLFRPGLAGYCHSDCAGHYRLLVSDTAVTVACYPGATEKPARTFVLKG